MLDVAPDFPGARILKHGFNLDSYILHRLVCLGYPWELYR